MRSDSGNLAPRLSIVIVSWNSRAVLERCLRSILAATKSVSFEVIVVDNNSSDDTTAVLRKRFGWVHLVPNDQNVGFARACNQGMARALGEYLLLLNSDTYVTDDVISRAVADLDERVDHSVLACELRFPDGRRQHSAERALSARRSLLQNLWLYKLLPPRGRSQRLLGGYYEGSEDVDADWLAGAFILLRRSVFERSGGFDERFFMYGEDCEWGMRLRRLGIRILYRPQTGVVYHTGAVSSDLVWTHKQRFWRCYEGGLTAYRIAKGPRRVQAFKVAELFGALVRWMVYRVVSPWHESSYLRGQIKHYGWIIEFYVSSLRGRTVEGRA